MHIAMWVSFGLVVAMARRLHRLTDEHEHGDLRFAEVIRFMVPTTATSVMFTLSRPVLYAFLSRGRDPLVAVAAFRIVYDLVAALQQVSNQFRHLFVTFGLDDMAGKRVFMARVCLVLTGALALAVLPGVGQDLVFGSALGLRGEVREAAVESALMLLPAPTILMVRNYYHGQLLTLRAPGGMAGAAALRVALLAAISALLLSQGMLDAAGTAVALLSGFAIEAYISARSLSRVMRLATQAAASG